MLKFLSKEDNLDTLLAESTSKPVLLNFFATWCPPCRMLGKEIERLEDKYKDQYTVIKVDVDQFNDLAAQYNVSSIPASFFVRNNEVVENKVGYMDLGTLTAKLTKLK
ncbi:thioredoxin domain-containing protein [Ureaplasma sp. ES3154-GEN]|uniref:thioredoxin family protein n=1 Tax=Ureaplasma sp. ES3154-GEN TaxID=2984844 RepID=UPI0021E866CE|nr:thioredoxin domain-containing protein [Ureaplasma sp. ES3154-GEN]MCV3743487.1 thioredoxin domain-containing protein [Ureaplasma sp. ES3154-GEN]